MELSMNLLLMGKAIPKNLEFLQRKIAWKHRSISCFFVSVAVQMFSGEKEDLRGEGNCTPYFHQMTSMGLHYRDVAWFPFDFHGNDFERINKTMDFLSRWQCCICLLDVLGLKVAVHSK